MKGKENDPRGPLIGRRGAMKIIVGTGAFIAADQLTRPLYGEIPFIGEIPPLSDSEIIFSQRQQERLKTARGIVLPFGGVSVSETSWIVNAVTPEVFNPLNAAVGHVDYAASDMDAESTAHGIIALQQQYPNLEELSVWGQSAGGNNAGEVLEHLDKEKAKIRLKHVFLDCPVVSSRFTDNPLLGNALTGLSGGTLFTAGVNWLIYGDPLKHDNASPGLLQDQLEETVYGEEHFATLLKRIQTDHSRVTLLTPKDPEKDPLVDALKVEAFLRGVIPGLRVFKLEGNQGHANSDKNTAAYQEAIRTSLALV